jgi:hypothetical protein
MPGAKAAFQSAVSALGPADHSLAHAPTLELPEWADDLGGARERWIDAADLDVRYELRLNEEGPWPMALGKSHSDGLWQLESAPPGALRVPAAPGSRLRAQVVARAAGGREQVLLRGSFEAPEALAFMGAPGHRVACPLAGQDTPDTYLFLHVLEVQGRGRCVVHACAWAPVEAP